MSAFMFEVFYVPPKFIAASLNRLLKIQTISLVLKLSNIKTFFAYAKVHCLAEQGIIKNIRSGKFGLRHHADYILFGVN